MNKKLIAPCGMNCGLCYAYLREKNTCPGCASGQLLRTTCEKCGIKICKERKGIYCFDCDKFPCERLKHMDKRYRTKYGMSEIENLKNIKEKGIKAFMIDEEKKWVNSKGTFCVHNEKRYLTK